MHRSHPDLPESFNVLIRELQALCLDVDLIKTRMPPIEAVPEDVEAGDEDDTAGDAAIDVASAVLEGADGKA